jgi:DNA-binding CsgD family transcriptional regulator
MHLPSQQSPELSIYLSGSDALKLLEFIHNSLSCTTKENFTALFPKIQELFSFDFALGVLGHQDNNGGIVFNGANISFPEQWLNESVSKNYLQVDAVIRENFSSYEVQHWSATRKKLFRREDINSLSQDFGMRECYTHGSRPSARGQNGSMFCFSSSSMQHDLRTVAILEFLTPHLHLALSHVFENSQSEIDNAVLSPREIEVLNWLKQGKSSWDISVILSISKRTVNFHVYNVIQKLGATNRTQAVAVATRMGLIDIG